MTHPAIPAPPHAGGCLCGAVRFTLAAAPLAINACYCADCQKLTGATNLLMLLASSAAFSARGAPDRWRKRADSGREIDIVRCKTCGVRLWHEPLSSPEYVFIAAGTLDDTSWAVPTSHIWTARAGANVHIPEDAFICDAQPAAREDLIAAFRKIHPR